MPGESLFVHLVKCLAKETLTATKRFVFILRYCGSDESCAELRTQDEVDLYLPVIDCFLYCTVAAQHIFGWLYKLNSFGLQLN